MKIEQTETHYKIKIGNAGYAIAKTDSSFETLKKASEFLSAESGQGVTITQLQEAISGLKS